MQRTRPWLTGFVALSLLISLTMFGCGSDDAENVNPLIDETLLRVWTLASIEMEDGSVLKPDTTYTITFTQEQVAPEDREFVEGALSLNVHDGCNNCRGGYELSETGSVSISIGSCTLIACITPLSLETLFVEALSDASSYEIQGDNLRIVCTNGDSGERNMLNFSAN